MVWNSKEYWIVKEILCLDWGISFRIIFLRNLKHIPKKCVWNPRDSAVTPLRFIPHHSDSRYRSHQAGLSDALSKGLLRQRTHLPQPRPLSRAVRHGDSVSLSVVYIWGGGQGPRGVAGFVPHASSRVVRHVCLSPGAFECGPLCRPLPSAEQSSSR